MAVKEEGEQRGAGMQERWRQGSSIQAFDCAGGLTSWKPPPQSLSAGGFPWKPPHTIQASAGFLRRCSSTAANSCSVAQTAGEAELDPRGHGPALPASSVTVGAPRGQGKSPLPTSQPALTRSLAGPCKGSTSIPLAVWPALEGGETNNHNKSKEIIKSLSIR